MSISVWHPLPGSRPHRDQRDPQRCHTCRARGEAPRDQEALADLICNYASMIYDLRDEVAETDANPVLVYEEGKGVESS